MHYFHPPGPSPHTLPQFSRLYLSVGPAGTLARLLCLGLLCHPWTQHLLSGAPTASGRAVFVLGASLSRKSV